MPLRRLHQDLYAHMEWADAAVWRTALADSSAAADGGLLQRLLHVHLTQRAFLAVWTAQPLDHLQELAFEDLPGLRAWARPFYPQVRTFLQSLSADRLEEPCPLPWAHYFESQVGRAPATTTLGETLIQLPSHTTYHRGQVNADLRRLGVVPPLVDYIAWLWGGRPAADWGG